MMQKHLLRLASLLLAGTIAAAPVTASTQSAVKHRAANYKIDLPPSAELNYTIKAKESGLTLSGEGKLHWQTDSKTFSTSTETRAMMIGKIHQSWSEGIIDAHGLAPVKFTEKRFRKPENTVTFDRQEGAIKFSMSDKTYPIKGGEQDRSSAIWQLVAIARGNPARFKEGSSWTFFVAGRNDGEPWTFKVGKRETVRTPMGNIPVLHVTRVPPPDAPDRRLEVWLAPSLEWYPARLRFADNSTEYIEQTLQTLAKK
jgi:hypothetical protein